MNIPDNLTKENFFNELMEKYPEKMNHFCSWIDEYKKANQWNDLFFNSRRFHPVKFHSLPLDMQIGIIYRYMYETDRVELVSWCNPEVMVKNISYWFSKPLPVK